MITAPASFRTEFEPKVENGDLSTVVSSFRLIIGRGVPKPLYSQLRGLEAYVKGSFDVMPLRLLRPCNKSGHVNLIVLLPPGPSLT